MASEKELVDLVKGFVAKAIADALEPRDVAIALLRGTISEQNEALLEAKAQLKDQFEDQLTKEVGTSTARIEDALDEIKKLDQRTVDMRDFGNVTQTAIDGLIAANSGFMQKHGDRMTEVETAINETVTELQKQSEQVTAIDVGLATETDAIKKEIKETKTDIAIKSQILDDKLTEATTETHTAFEIRMLATLDRQDSSINQHTKDLQDQVEQEIGDVRDRLDDTLEMKSLGLANTVNTEFLRMNNQINTRLNTLKGDKGDCGEKGQQGNDGSLSGVSVWATGNIKNRDDAVTHKNGVWLCSAKQTASEPSLESGDWALLSDGVVSHSISEDGSLIVTRSSGREEDVGQVTFNISGTYDKSKTYDKLALVMHNKMIYVSTCNKNSSEPPSGDKWIPLTRRGNKGPAGAQGKQGPSGKDGQNNMGIDDVLAIVESTIEVKRDAE